MASFNKVVLVGNITRDPSLKYTPSNTPVCEFGLACNRRFKASGGEDREEVTFVDVVAFGKQGETINQYCSKGKPLLVEGRLKYDTWEDKQGGGKRSKLSVVVENFQFIGGRDDGGEGQPPARRGGQHETQYPKNRNSVSQRPQAPHPFSENQEFTDDEVPFAWPGRLGQPV